MVNPYMVQASVIFIMESVYW